VVTGAAPSREDYFRVLAACLPDDTLVVTCLGNASYLWARLRDRPENLYVEDAMGLALPLALGLAVAQPRRRVVAVEGDGGLLMHLGALVTVGAVAPKNLTVLLIQNGVHAASGGQALTNPDLDLAALARSAGLPQADTVRAPEALRRAVLAALQGDGPAFLALATAPDPDVVVPPAPLNPVVVKQRFMDALGAPRYIPSTFGEGRFVEATPAPRRPGRASEKA
jgi:thiamine pyrophosphate-dependent acetolactate synthase large subunit-like protein